MRASTVNLLACPACRGDLLLRERLAHRGEVLEGSLVCSRCGAEYEVSNGIPRLLPSPASGLERQIYGSIMTYYDSYVPFMEERYHNARVAYMRRVEDACVMLTGPRGLVLDIGCGTGRQALLLAGLGCEVVAMDISLGMLLEARRRALRKGLAGRIEFVQASADSLPFKPGTFDRAYAIFGAFNHAPRYRRAFGLAYEVLRPGGRLLLTVLNRYQLTLWLEAILGRRKKQLRRLLSTDTCYMTVRYGRKRRRLWTKLFSARELGRLLRSAGFKNIRIGGILVFLRPKFSYEPRLELVGLEAALASLEDRLRWLPPFSALGTYLIALADK